MQYLKTLLLILILGITNNLSAQDIQENIQGLWDLGDGDKSKVEFSLTEDGFWQGIITETEVARSIGKILFKKGVYDPEENKIVGVLLHPDSGWGVKGTLTLESATRLKAVASKFFISKTFYWER